MLNHFHSGFFTSVVRFAWYAVAFGLVGWNLVKAAVLNIPSGNIFNEFLLMNIATVGAFAIGESGRVREPGQAQHLGAGRIQATKVTVLRAGAPLVLDPKQVQVGE